MADTVNTFFKEGTNLYASNGCDTATSPQQLTTGAGLQV